MMTRTPWLTFLRTRLVTRMCRPSRGVSLLIGIFEQLLEPVFRAF